MLLQIGPMCAVYRAAFKAAVGQIHCATATEYLDRSNPATFSPPHSTREVTFDLIPGFVTRVFFGFQMDVDPAVRLPEAPVDTS